MLPILRSNTMPFSFRVQKLRSSLVLALSLGWVALWWASVHVKADMDVSETPPITKQSTCKEILKWLPIEMEIKYPVLLQVVDKNFLQFQANFMAALQNHSTFPISNIYLLCLDLESLTVAETLYGIRCVEVDHVAGRKGVWKIRVHALACMVTAGKDVLVSDLDAVWLRDPLPALTPIRGDILLQRGNWPKKMQDPVTGMTMCMGFALFRASGERMAEFMAELLRLAWSRNDDQIGLLYAAYEHGLRWDYDYSSSDMRLRESTRPGYGYINDFNITFTLLPHNQFIRKCFDLPLPEGVVVAHCTILDRETDKVKKMKNESTWFLD